MPPEDILGNNYCGICFKDIAEYIEDALTIDNFNLLTEWFNTVPFPIQIYLKEAFICKQSLKKQRESEFYKTKLTSLFCIWEGLLNVLSRFYSGIVQTINTDELLVNYHNITTVFNITAHTGISQSLRTGNR